MLFSWFSQYRIIFPLSIIAIISIVPNISAIDNFFWLDDFLYLESVIKADDSIGHIFQDRLIYGFFRPLSLGSILIVYKFFGLNPLPFQILGILAHFTASCLVFLLGLKLTKDHTVALLAGLLFGIHRVHTISTFWMCCAFSTELCFIFYLSCLIAYVCYISNSKTQYYIFAIITFTFAILIKEAVITLLPTLILYEGYLLVQKDTKLWSDQLRLLFRRLTPFLILFFCMH